MRLPPCHVLDGRVRCCGRFGLFYTRSIQLFFQTPDDAADPQECLLKAGASLFQLRQLGLPGCKIASELMLSLF